MAKKNMRNEFEFMASVLDALGVDYEEADIKVRERWRKKCIEGLSKNSGGGSKRGLCNEVQYGWVFLKSQLCYL